MPIEPGRGLKLAAVRTSWLLLAQLAFVLGLLADVPFWLSVAGLVFAAIPAIAGMIVRNFVKETSSDEIEITLWVVFATLGMAVTGGAASPLAAGFAVAFMLAASTGRRRLVIESVAFSVLGYLAALLVGLSGHIIESTVREKLASVYSVAAVALLARLVWLAVVSIGNMQRPNWGLMPVLDTDGEPAEFDLAEKLRMAEARHARLAAAAIEARTTAAKAETALASRTRFFAQTSHELRTPLNAIIGFAEMMRNSVFGPLPQRYQEYAELIHEGGRDLSLIVDDVLDLARIEAGRYEIHRETESLTDLAAEAVHFMQQEAARKQVSLQLDEGDDTEAFIDTKAVRQIALNLISNALKFTPPGGSVMVRAFANTGGAWLAVSDTGAGMSVEELTRLSRAFEQGQAGKEQKGTGLGLSVVRAFAELHGGRLDIESRQGGGSTVAVFFPDEKTEA
jgi:signal transduction histidine kinase